MLYHDVPKCQGVANGLKRARQLAEIRWTPVDYLPHNVAVWQNDGEHTRVRAETFAPPYMQQIGMVYSSTRAVEKFVGYNVSIETFMTALTNPRSVLYTRNLFGTGGHGMGTYYGTVCSCYVSYILDLPYRYSTNAVPKMACMQEVDTTDLDNLQLLDPVNKAGAHIGIITDIVRDEQGHVAEIEVSESTQPFVRARRFDQTAFRGYWLANGYKVYRYDGLEKISYTPTPFVPLPGDPEAQPEVNKDLMPNFGNKANYVLGMDSDRVELDILKEGWETVEVTAPDGKVTAYAIENMTVYPAETLPGYYSACCVTAAGKKSAPVFWCLADLKVETDKTVFKVGEPIPVRFKNSLDEPIHHWFVNRADNYIKSSGSSDKGLREGEVVMKGPDKPGKYWYIVIARGAYGSYTSRFTYFDVTE